MTEQDAFAINVNSPIAVYIQIENQVQFAVASGRLKPGDTLPSVREMSAMLGINPNTVTKAYRDLEILKLVRPRRGVGVTITDMAVKACRDTVPAMVKGHLVDAVAECVAAGISGAEIRKIVAQTVEGRVGPYRPAK